MRKSFKNNIQFATILLLLLCLGCKNKSNTLDTSKFSSLKVMTWNIWGEYNLEPRYTMEGKTARQRVVEIIKDSGADIITMTETYGSAQAISKALDFYYYTPSPEANLTIFSRYPLEDFGNVNGLSPFSFIAATTILPSNQKIRVYNIWLTSGGRHIVAIKDNNLSDAEFNDGDENRYKHIQQLLQHEDFKKDLANKDQIPLIVAGDFNCVSHLDFTEETKASGLNFNRLVANKTSIAMANAGFTDTYRSTNPKITQETLGYTWTTVGLEFTYESDLGFVPIKTDTHPEPEYRNPFARIDFIYSTGENIIPLNSKTIVHHSSNLNRSFPEFPSDHGAVLTTFQINQNK
ncbi:MAG: endonuclease/exonuclease/phosphatase family protein [Arenibacter latericius]|nr:endonuclease/exonuclease/phosphatase family protein [Arenibacter latericius]